MQRSISLVTVALGLMTAAGAMPPQQAVIRPSEGASTCCAAGPCTASSALVLTPVKAAAACDTITIEELVKRLGDPKQREATLQAVRTGALRVDSGSASAVAKAATKQAEHALHASMAQAGAVDLASIAGQATRAAMPAIESALRALEAASVKSRVVRQDPKERDDDEADDADDAMIIEDLEVPDVVLGDFTLDGADLGGWSVGTLDLAPEANTEQVEAGQSHDHESLEERITALERLARKRAYAGAQSLDDDHDKKSLEERVAELERILRDPANAKRYAPRVMTVRPPPPPTTPPPSAPHAAIPGQPRTPRAWGGMGYVNPETMSKIDEKAQRKLEEAHRRLEEAQREREKVLREHADSGNGDARSVHPRQPQPRANNDELRGQMESLMHDMRAQMDSMREEMARMRAELERMPRHESR